jgi:hypothetical protein
MNAASVPCSEEDHPMPLSTPLTGWCRTRRPRALLAQGLAAAFLGTLVSLPALASRPERQVTGDLVDVQIKVNGRETPLYFAPNRFDRHYFQAFRGRNYSLVLHNNTGERVGVLIAIDGLNVVNGERSRLSPSEAMYVLDPYEQAEIRGWRTSLRDVRKFVFVDEEQSYAERSGKANGDMGWIRVLSFEEHGRPLLSEDHRLDRRRGFYGDASDAPTSEGLPPSTETRPAPGSTQPDLSAERNITREKDSNPGTGWGDQSRDPVNRTWFTPAPEATDHIVLRYEYKSGLLALGIDVRRPLDRLLERERGDFGFAQPPRR